MRIASRPFSPGQPVSTKRTVLDKDGGLRTGRLLSQSIVVQVPGFDRLMIITDAAINIAPTLAQKAEICRNAIQAARALGIEQPNIAALCALEMVNYEMPATLDAAALAAILPARRAAGVDPVEVLRAQ